MVVAEILRQFRCVEGACVGSRLSWFTSWKDSVVLVIIASVLEIMFVVHQRLGTFLNFGVEASRARDLLRLGSELLGLLIGEEGLIGLF